MVYHRNSIILHGLYEQAFTAKAIEGKLVVPSADLDISDPELLKMYQWETNEHLNSSKFNKHKKAVLQMALIYDKLILIDSNSTFDFGKLKESGLIESISFLGEPLLQGNFKFKDDKSAIHFSKAFKKIIIDSIVKEKIKHRHQVIEMFPKGVGNFAIKKFYESLYRMHIEHLHPKNIEELLRDFGNFQKVVRYVRSSFPKVRQSLPASIDRKSVLKLLVESVTIDFEIKIGALLTMLSFSSENNGILLQSDFDFSKIIGDSNKMKFQSGKPIVESYELIRVAYQNLIGMLPELNSIEDVLRLKDKHRKEILRLREVLDEVEFNLRNGHKKGIAKANQEVSKAVKELNRTKTLDRISKWTTYLSLPVGVLELLLQLPPIASFITGVSCIGSTYESESLKERNNWLTVVR